jgi:hypothetical protein
VPERRRRLRAIVLALGLALGVGTVLAIGAAPAEAAEPRSVDVGAVLALVPGEQGPNGPGGGGGGPDLGLILGVLVAGAVGLAVAAGLGYLMLRRRARAPMEPPPGTPEAGEWWTCRNCGRNNIVGSARCYSCGAWQR